MAETGEVDVLKCGSECLADVLVEPDVALRVLLAPAVEELIVLEVGNRLVEEVEVGLVSGCVGLVVGVGGGVVGAVGLVRCLVVVLWLCHVASVQHGADTEDGD